MVMVLSDPSLLSSRETLSLSLGSLAAVAIAYQLLVARPRLPPGTHAPRRAPTAHWFWGDLLSLLRNAARFNDWVFETTRACDEQPWLQSGPLVPQMVIVSTPAIVEDVTRTQHDSFGKGDFTRDNLFELVGDAFFSLDGAAWFHQRKIATKFFSARMYRDIATPITHAHVARALAKLDKAQDTATPTNVSAVLSAFALQNFAELAFGLDIERVDPAPLDKAFDDAFVCIFHRVQRPKWLWTMEKWLNVGNERKLSETVGFIRTFVSTLVSESLEKSAAKDADTTTTTATTIVELFINAMRSGEGAFSPALLCDVAIMFVVAGRDTTSDTLTWFFYNLAKHPDVEQKIRDELWEKVPRLMDGTDAVLPLDQTPSLVYLEATLKETMRLYPATTISPRQALSDAILVDGTFIPKGMRIGISSYAMGRSTSVWGDDAAQFNPDRFIDHTTGKIATMSPFKFYGFGSGPRNCIGMSLAMLQMKMLISAMLSRFRFEFAPNDGSYKFSANLTLDHPLMAKVHAAPARQ